jgi:DNA-binding transcriptional ArsR family regulator
MRTQRDKASSKRVPLTFLCPASFAILAHEVWRLRGKSGAWKALVYMILEEPRTSREISAAVGASQRSVQQRLNWLRRCGLVESEDRRWKRTDLDLNSAAERLGTAGAGARLRERHIEERVIYGLRGALRRRPRGRLRVKLDLPENYVEPGTGDLLVAPERAQNPADLSAPPDCPGRAWALRDRADRAWRRPDPQLVDAVSMITRVFPDAKLIAICNATRAVPSSDFGSLTEGSDGR